jgi:hypothetical protein
MRECRHPNIVLFLGLAKEPGEYGRTFVGFYIPISQALITTHILHMFDH